MLDWNPYLNSLCNAYTQWWTFGTLKDVVKPSPGAGTGAPRLLFDFGLMVQTVERDAQHRSKQEQKVERLGVLEGLQKYAPKHVVLVGRPGSGKSTALVRLLVEIAQQARQNPHSQIPVLVELRTYKIYDKTSVLDLVQASLKRHRLCLNIETIEELLAQGRFLLLMDGINELPDDEARKTIKEFRLDSSDVPMVFTTRDLGVGDDLGIENKLEMQSLKEAEVEKFVRECMPEGTQQTLQQLRQRSHQLEQTPFVMWMLYFIVQKTGTVPSGVGSAFREFAQLYERRSKDDAPVSDESRRWWSRLLEHLAFEMMQAEKPTDLRLSISKQKAVDILTKVLDSENFDKPRDYALRWLEDLLKHHLIQVTSNDQIEFCHQLIQEYYAAEYLLKVLTSRSGRTSPLAPLLQGEGSKIPVPPNPCRKGGLGGLGLGDDELKRDYLKYLKWTEPLVLMLELLEDERQAVRVVRLALDVNLRLGARLAGAVKREFQEKTVSFIVGRKAPQPLKIRLLGVTGSDYAIPFLSQDLNHTDPSIRKEAVYALAQISSEVAATELGKSLKHPDPQVRRAAVYALARMSTEVAAKELGKTLNHPDIEVRTAATSAIEQLYGEGAMVDLLEALANGSTFVRWKAASELGRNPTQKAVTELRQALADEATIVREAAASALAQIGGEVAIVILSQALTNEDPAVRWVAVEALSQINNQAAIEALRPALADKDLLIRCWAASALGQSHNPEDILELHKALADEATIVREIAASAVARSGSETAVSLLSQALKHENPAVRLAAIEGLGQIKHEAAAIALRPVVKDPDRDVRFMAACALRQIIAGLGMRNSNLASTLKSPNSLEDGLTVQSKRPDSDTSLIAQSIRDFAFRVRSRHLESSASSPKQSISSRISHILHLSDLHFGTLDQANLWSSQLAKDLHNELDIPQLDALILSGDIANYSTPDEYNAAEQFLNKLRQYFPLTQEQIIIVPGNHDINWELAKKAYRLEQRKTYQGELQEGCYIDRGDIIEVRDEQDYKQRFANFSNFYQALKGEPYPLDYEQQGILYHLSEQNLLILGLNSAWQLDHHYKTRASIHPIALSNALDQISRDRKTYHNCRKIAVWHHPIRTSGSDRITDTTFCDRLAVAGFRLFLHGHVHEAKTSNYRYDMTKDGHYFDLLGAGTFGTSTKELVTGTPWQYNLLKFEGSNKLTVRTRCRRKENDPWEPDSIWSQGRGKGEGGREKGSL